MSLLTKTLQPGDTIYTFEQAGDVLTLHTHTEADVHYMIVARGRVRIDIPDSISTEYAAGAIVDPGYTHEIVALEDNSRIVNILKRGENAS